MIEILRKRLVGRESFNWKGKNSFKDFGLTVVERDAPSPEEKEVRINLPYSQGDIDLSSPQDEQFFNSRIITYTLARLGRQHDHRKYDHLLVENWLRGGTEDILVETYSEGFYYVGKFVGVIPRNSTDGSRVITYEAVFKCQPFKISVFEEGTAYFDDMNLMTDVIQKTFFELNGTRDIKLYNNSVTSIVPKFEITGLMEIENDNVVIVADDSSKRSDLFRLKLGMNNIQLRGQGTIKFIWQKRLL